MTNTWSVEVVAPKTDLSALQLIAEIERLCTVVAQSALLPASAVPGLSRPRIPQELHAAFATHYAMTTLCHMDRPLTNAGAVDRAVRSAITDLVRPPHAVPLAVSERGRGEASDAVGGDTL